MYYNISINQKAIVDFNKQNTIKIDLIDGVIIEYLQKQSTSSFAKRNHIIKDNEIYFLLSYENIITQLPLLNIENKEVIGRRIKKLKDLKVINQFVDRKQNNKVYFNTTDIFESFFSYDLPTQKSNPPDSKVENLPTQKSNHIYIDNNINDNNINDNKKIYKKEISLSKKEDLEQIKENHLKENNYSQEEEEAVKEYFDLRYKQHKGLAKTERALKTLLNGIQELKSKGYDVVKVVKKLDRNGNVLQKHELSGRENLYKDCISDVARFNQIVAKEVEKNKTKELEKAVKRKIENEKINQEVIDW